MFSGIIGAIGFIAEIIDCDGDKRMTINTGDMDISKLATGDSLNVNGVCLTVIEKTRDSVLVDISPETLSCTAFGEYMPGSRVNLEQALQVSDRINGHIVSGHVDGVGRIVSVTPDARSTRYIIDVPSQFCRYLCHKGSICIDGVSLTVNEVNGEKISVNIIPYTREHTVFSDYTAGTAVNIEIDIIARYVESLQQYHQ